MPQIDAPRTGSFPGGTRSIDGSRAELASAPADPYRVTFGCSLEAPTAPGDVREGEISREH